MARGPTLTGVAVLAILIILAGLLVRGMHHGLHAGHHSTRPAIPGAPR